jgi:hypothetical protein
MPAPDPTAALLEAVRNYVAAYHPGRFPVSLRVRLDAGPGVRMPVGPCPCKPAVPPDPPKLNEMERDVLQSLGEATMNAEEISRVAGYPNDTNLRSCLATMRRRGLLTGKQGEAGYAVANP